MATRIIVEFPGEINFRIPPEIFVVAAKRWQNIADKIVELKARNFTDDTKIFDFIHDAYNIRFIEAFNTCRILERAPKISQTNFFLTMIEKWLEKIQYVFWPLNTCEKKKPFGDYTIEGFFWATEKNATTIVLQLNLNNNISYVKTSIIHDISDGEIYVTKISLPYPFDDSQYMTILHKFFLKYCEKIIY